MQTSIFLTAATLLLSGAMAQYDTVCGLICSQKITDCCHGDGQACGQLSNTCGANWISNACADTTGACGTYCSISPIANCINSI